MQDHFLRLRDGVGHSTEYKAPILNITGGPGVGKSFLVKVLDDSPYFVPVAFMIATCPFAVLSDSSVASGEDNSEDHTLSVRASE